MDAPRATTVLGPELSAETLRRVDILFAPADRDRAKKLLRDQCGNNLPFLEKADPYALERFRFAAMKYSDGSLAQLESAVKLAQRDWRDLLMASGFANSLSAHERWEPKPFSEPSLIEAPKLAAGIHERLARVLGPLGFVRDAEVWRRSGETPQSVQLVIGLTSRVETRFFLRVHVDAKPRGVLLNLPRLPAGKGMFSAEGGYVFRAGDKEDTFYEGVGRDLDAYVQPWCSRFTSDAEVRRGFEDGTFKPYLPLKDCALIF